MRAALIFILLLPVSATLAQSNDSLLANERTMDRPITLHKGQIRMGAGYAFSLYSRRFDNDAEHVDLTQEGRTRLLQGSFFSVAYGISNIFQVSVATGFKRQIDRERDRFIVVGAESIQGQYLSETKGIEDLNVALDVRAPGLPRKFDLGITLGASLPIAESGNMKPKHSAQLSTDHALIKYHYDQRWGNGVTRGMFGVRAKFRSKDWAITAAGVYHTPFGESVEDLWIHELDGDEFAYQSFEYKTKKQSELTITGEFEYQPLPWLNTFVIAELRQWGGGWSTETGGKVAAVEAYLASVQPGIEIMITSRLWLRQRFQFTVAGQNQMAPFTINTSISYNFFHKP
jgi:hypothetical protein